MLKTKTLKLASIVLTLILTACSSSEQTTEERARAIVRQMTLPEKIGQKIMISFRYWCSDDKPDCTTGMTQYNEAVGTALAQNKIGGIILFSDNLANIDQTAELIWKLQQAAIQDAKIGLFISVDQEGGNVARLPRTIATNFPGNMALGAAYQATQNEQLAYQQGQILAAEIRSVGFNVNFSPAVDVNSNPLNPVINVRAYGDDPLAVGLLGGQAARGMSSQQVISAFKHFPGHGDTATDSHYGLPIVYKSRQEAEKIDLAPYKTAIQKGIAPDMIMTAHIQYPALDNSTLTSSKTHQTMIVPATLSRKIQHDLLRNELGYQGITVTDALVMKGIADFFEPKDAVIQAFQADVDIALMPVEFRVSSNAYLLAELIDAVTAAVSAGQLSEAALDESVQRIVALKLRRGIIHTDDKNLDEIKRAAHQTIGKPAHKAVESDITQKSITMIKNDHHTLPLRFKNERIHIITPWGEQAEAMRKRFETLGYAASGVKISSTTWQEQKNAIDQADVIIVGTLSTAPSPVEKNGDPHAPPSISAQLAALSAVKKPVEGSLVFNVDEDHVSPDDIDVRLAQSEIGDRRFARQAMEYAKRIGKKVIHITLRAPYDVVNYDDVADATIATYSYNGDEKGLLGPSLPVAVDIMIGKIPAQGKLPVNIWAQNPDGSLGQLKYPRGFGFAL